MSTAPQRRANDGKPQEVRLTDDTIQYLNEQIGEAVARGIKGAITEDTAKAFWAAGFTMLQDQASEHAGRFVIGGLWGLMRKLMMFLTLGGIVYAIGGWSGLAALFKALFSHGGS